ncbi:MAG: hypothetical protein LBF88_13985 [Planctomycetaceae bacterium]|nr:hypothetical protein [Planctomycetaceae bacterium]
MKQKLLATETQLTAANARRATLATSYLNAGGIAALKAEQSAMAATAVARRNYLNQLGLMNVGLNKSAAAVMVMSNADIVAGYRKNLLTGTTIRYCVALRTSTAVTYASAVATKALAWSYLSAGAAIKAHPIMFSAMIVAGIVAATIAVSKFREKIAELHDEMSKQRETGDQSRTVDDKKMQRLQQLASQQKLSNSEMKEAETLAQQLEGKYGDFGVTIDKTTNSIDLAADAMNRFMESMNAKALQELEAELKEGEKNFQELQKEMNGKSPGMMGAISGVFDWRNSQLNTGFGYSKDGLLGDTTEKQMRELGEKQTEQMKKNNETRKKINRLKGGENATDVAKDESALLDEKISEGATVSLKEAEKKIAEMQRSMERDRKTSLENEIADLKERNEEYKKYLKMLIEAEMAKKPEDINWTNYNNWNEQLTNADNSLNADIDRLLDKRLEGYQKMIDQAGMSDFEKELYEARAKARKDYEEGAKIIDAKIAQLDPTKDADEIAKLNAQKTTLGEIEQNEVQKIYDKAKVDADKLALFPAEKEVSDKMALRDAAVATGDLDKIKKAQKDLEKAKKDLEMTSFKQVQAALKNAQTEYQTALTAFQNAKEGDEKAIAGNKLNEAEKKLDEIESQYNGMSEKQYNDKIKDLTDNARKTSFGEMFKSSGTFSAFELGSLDNSVAKEQLNELRIIGKEVKEIKRKKTSTMTFK